MSAIAHAEPGGIVYHCGRGRDRTGLVTLLLLALVGVAPEDIASDYELSTDGVRLLDSALGEEDQASIIEEILARKKTSARALILDILASLDVDVYLREAGLLEGDLAAIRARLLEPADSGEVRTR